MSKVKVASPEVLQYAQRHDVDLSRVTACSRADGRISLSDVRGYMRDTKPAPRVTPEAEKLADEHDVDLYDVKGTGAGGRIEKEDVLRATRNAPEPVIPRYVRSFATEHNVPLSDITPGDADGVMSLLDVMEWAKAKGDMTLQLDALEGQLRWNAGNDTPSPWSTSTARPRSGTVSGWDVKRMPVDATARNPLVDQVRAAARAQQLPSPAGAPPELFVTGATPAFTASGIPPETVLQAPWPARHAMASAPTASEAMAILTECSVPDGAETAQMLYGSHPGNQDYADRVEDWRVASLTDHQLAVEPGPAATAERQRREAELTQQPLSADDEAMIRSLAGQYTRH